MHYVCTTNDLTKTSESNDAEWVIFMVILLGALIQLVSNTSIELIPIVVSQEFKRKL